MMKRSGQAKRQSFAVPPKRFKRLRLGILAAATLLPLGLAAPGQADPTYLPISYSNNNVNDYLAGVQFNTIDNTTTCEPGGYGDYTVSVTDVTRRSGYTLTVTYHPEPGIPGEDVVAWIDWNSNGSFNDAGERYNLILNDPQSAQATVSRLITIPTDAASGAVRMRVVQSWGSQEGMNSGILSFGEAEDYTINIQTGPPVVSTDAASVVTASGATLNGTVYASGGSTTVIFDYGISTGYLGGPAVVASHSPVTGTANTPVSVSISGLICNTLYHFRVRGYNSAGATNGSDATFTTGVCPTPTSSIVIDPLTPTTLYAGLDNAGVFKSDNGGATWTPATSQPANPRVKELVIKPGDSTTLYAATYGGGVYKSSNSSGDPAYNGLDWTVCSDGATANSGLTNLNVVSLTIDAGGTLYAGTEAGVFVSTDNCATWMENNNGLPN